MAIDVGVKGGIITGGLGRPACQGMITMGPFSLWCAYIAPPKAVSGGSIPLAPGEIQDFYTPLESGVGLPGGEGKLVDPSVYGKKVIRFVVRFNDHTVEKEYLVNEKRAKHIIQILNLVNATKARISVVASGIKRITTHAMVTVKNIRVKYFK